jgi:Domain of unknown function (DUF4331)
MNPSSRGAALAVLASAWIAAGSPSFASDHLDTRTVIEDPRADIGDLYAWTSYDAKRLNLVMAMVGHTFSPDLQYVFHIDSGKAFGKTTVTVSIVCEAPAADAVYCYTGNVDSSQGDAIRVFAGLRDDPFFNNVKGSRAAYQKAAAAMKNGATPDAAGCPRFDADTSKAILNEWQHTDGGPAKNFLIGWTPASLVVSVDLNLVNKGGSMLAVWGVTRTLQKQIDRMGRPLTGNAMLAPLAADEVSDNLKEQYNRSTEANAPQFIPEIQKTLGLYDSFDGQCGNSLLAGRSQDSPARYSKLATLLADDRLWVNSESTLCMQFFAVELASLTGQGEMAIDCGGRTPTEDAVDVYRSLLVTGATTGVTDGVDRDEIEPSISAFPFLAPPKGNY